MRLLPGRWLLNNVCRKSIRPHQCSEALGGVVMEMEGKKYEQETKDAMGDDEIDVFDDDQQVVVTEVDGQGEATSNSTQVRVIPSARPPSRQETVEHNCTHIPFRSWCPHIVRRKAESDHHRAGEGLGVSETPVVSEDYGLLETNLTEGQLVK